MVGSYELIRTSSQLRETVGHQKPMTNHEACMRLRYVYSPRGRDKVSLRKGKIGPRLSQAGRLDAGRSHPTNWYIPSFTEPIEARSAEVVHGTTVLKLGRYESYGKSGRMTTDALEGKMASQHQPQVSRTNRMMWYYRSVWASQSRQNIA
jgi:hypothetical protein